VNALGMRLKQERERRGITLEEVALATKISTRFLHAIEAEQFDQLPGGIFNKGFIRAYARHLGLDEEEAITAYLEATGAAVARPSDEDVPQSRLSEQKTAGAGDLPWEVFAIGLLMVALGFAGWGFYSRERLAKSPAPSQALKSPSSGDSGSPSGAQPAEAVLQPENVAASSPVPPPASHENGAAVGVFSVSIKTNDESWISIAVDGKNLLQDMLLAGTRKTFTAEKSIVIKTGNAGAIDFAFNGEALPRQGEDGEVKTLVFDAGGLRPAEAQPETVAKPQPE